LLIVPHHNPSSTVPWHHIAMPDEQRLPARIYLMKERLLRVLKIGGDCMERFVRFVAWLTSWTSGWL
jgi:hypothetical protein